MERKRQENYINDLRTELAETIEDLDKKYYPGNYVFMQDEAPAHISFLSSLYLKRKNNIL